MALNLSALKNKTTAKQSSPPSGGTSGGTSTGTSDGTPVSFDNVSMTGAAINGATITNSNITDPAISGGTMTGTVITDCDLTAPDINGGNLIGVTITSSTLNDCTYNDGVAYNLKLVDPIFESSTGGSSTSKIIDNVAITNSTLTTCDGTDLTITNSSWDGGTVGNCTIGGAIIQQTTINTSELNSCAMDGGTVENATIGDCNMVANKYKQIGLIGNGNVVLNIHEAAVFAVIAAGNVSITFKNFTNASFQSIVLFATNFGGKTITFPIGTRFPGGTAISFTTGGTDVIVIIKDGNDMYTVYPVAYNVK